MTIDWQKEVEARKEALFKDLFDLLSIPSVREDDKATADAPVGPGPKEALLRFLEIGERDGFITKNIDNLAGHLEYGAGDETMGIFGHVDVVPVGTGWDTDPFKPEIRDGKLYARGSSDDKGPSVAAYYGLKIIKELGLPISKRVRFIIGTDEESGWSCMNRYLEVEEKPDFGFAPDAEFPIINGEKGMANINVNLGGTNAGDYRLVSFESGLRPNMVPESATAVVEVASVEAGAKMEVSFLDFVEKNPVSGTIDVNGTTVTVVVNGKSAHGASPAAGINGGTFMAVFLAGFTFGADAQTFIDAAANYLHEESRGTALEIAHTDEVMGELTMNPGIFNFQADAAEGNKITLNIRFPKGVTHEGLETQIGKKLGDNVRIDSESRGQVPHYVPGDDPLVKTLLEVYEKHTGLKGAEKVIGGGTFGRLLERGVAYGAMFPDSIDTMHQANEFMAVDDIMKATVIYADAIYSLIK
ncbi:dipeptidase PepV [uncultured Vagococcus sp.]|uniref:dipeptidase PepV n=1 Tax=uncultured Vagococcus sp. TaxID=189676 RepID=UPI0028D78401|nr:dipeptidase PepV [uncultured Vagococcus sp.]